MKETIDKIRAACKANRTPLLFMLLFIAAFVVLNGREIAQEVSVTYSSGGPDDAGNGALTEGTEKALAGNDSDADEIAGDGESDGTDGAGSADGEPGDGEPDGKVGDEAADGKSADGESDDITGDGDADGKSGSGATDGKSADGESDDTAGDGDADGKSRSGAADDASGDGGSGGDDDTALTQEELSRHERRLLSQMGSSFRIPMNMPERLRSGYVLAGATESRSGTGRAEMRPDGIGSEDGQREGMSGDVSGNENGQNEEMSDDASGNADGQNEEVSGDADGDADSQNDEMSDDASGNADGQNEKASGDADEDADSQNDEMSDDASGNADGQNEEVSGDADGDADSQSEKTSDDADGDADSQSEEMSDDASESEEESGNEKISDAENMLAERLKNALTGRSGRVVLRDVSMPNALFEDGDARLPELVRNDGAVLYELEDPVMVPYLELHNWRYLRGFEVLSPEQAAWYGITVTIPDGLVEYKGKYDIYEIRDLSMLQTMLETKTAEYDGVWSVYVKNLTSGDSFVINDNSMKSASVMKLFVMGTVYKAFESGELERTDEVMALVNNMIINSDNESTNQLLYRLGDSDYEEGIQKVDEFIAEYGFSDMTVEYNGFENPDTVTVSGSYNQVAAKDCGKLLEDIYRRTWTSRSVSNEMEQLLLSQSTRYKIPAGLPEGVLCGNKTGEMDTTENDAAIIYGEDCDYVLVVLSSDWASKDQAISRIQEISRTVYEFLN